MYLNKKFLETNRDKLKDISIGNMEEMPERVIQFGEGNFLRAFVDWQFDQLNKKGLFSGKVVIVQPLHEGMINAINEQNGLYTLLMRGIKNGEQIEKTEIITSVSRGINPYSGWDEYLKCASNPELRFMVSNTTEAGIAYVKTPLPKEECPASFPAKATAFLYERFKKFNGSDEKGMIIIPCELIENNGTTLKRYILQHAADWNLEKEFSEWIEENNFFYNTLVDRIVPGFPKDEIEAITKKLGYEDKIIVSAEIFHLWVIQGNEIAKNELPFTDAGLNVVWTDDITPYRTLKVRILNGAHTMLTIPSYLAGNNTVRESIEDEVAGGFLKEGLFNEILPTLEFPYDKKLKYAEEIIERFLNPFIKHYLLSITLNSISKFKVRVLPSLLRYFEINNIVPDVLTFSLAALITFYRGQCADGSETKKDYPVNDDVEVIKFFNELKNQNDCDKIVTSVLANKNFWDEDLNRIEGLKDGVAFYYKLIGRLGMKPAISELLISKTAKHNK